MTDTNVIKLAQPGTFTDSLTEILRDGARALLTQAVETEVSDFRRALRLLQLPRRALDASTHDKPESRARSRPSGIERSDQEVASQTRPPSP